MLRLAFLSKTVLASLLLTSYVTVLALTGAVTGYFANSISSRLGWPHTKNLDSGSRPDSRVDRWLKAQAVSYVTPDPSAHDTSTQGQSLPDLTSQNSLLQDFRSQKTNASAASGDVSAAAAQSPIARDLPAAVALAVAIDASEQTAPVAAAASEPSEVQRITRPVNRRQTLIIGCWKGSCDAGMDAAMTAAMPVAAKLRKSGNPLQFAAHKPRHSKAASQVAGFQRTLSGKTKVALGLKTAVQTRSKLVAYPSNNIHLADSPADIIQRSLRGTS